MSDPWIDRTWVNSEDESSFVALGLFLMMNQDDQEVVVYSSTNNLILGHSQALNWKWNYTDADCILKFRY